MVTIGNAASTIGVPNIPGDQQEGVTPGGNTWPAPRTPVGIPGSHPRALGLRNIEGRGTPLKHLELQIVGMSLPDLAL